MSADFGCTKKEIRQPEGIQDEYGTINKHPKLSISDAAAELIYGDREGTYGNPAKNLRAIADFWQVYLYNLTGNFHDLSTEDVCNMMVLMKTARLINSPLHRDSLVDVIGYTLLKERIAQTRGKELT